MSECQNSRDVARRDVQKRSSVTSQVLSLSVSLGRFPNWLVAELSNLNFLNDHCHNEDDDDDNNNNNDTNNNNNRKQNRRWSQPACLLPRTRFRLET